MEKISDDEIKYLRLLKISYSPKNYGKPFDGFDASGNRYFNLTEGLKKIGILKSSKHYLHITKKGLDLSA